MSEPTKTAAELLREVAAADPEGHKRRLAIGYGCGDPQAVYPSRPVRREDGWPTRADIRSDTDAERLCRVLVNLVEGMGASVALTRAVGLLEDARNAIADHVESSVADRKARR